MNGLDPLRQALEDLDRDNDLDRRAIERVTVAAVGHLQREIDAAKRRRFQRQLPGLGR